MENAAQTQMQPVTHLAQLPVQCPQCHWKQFVEIHLDNPLADSPMAIEIRRQLEAWMASHCPDHLNVISNVSRN